MERSRFAWGRPLAFSGLWPIPPKYRRARQAQNLALPPQRAIRAAPLIAIGAATRGGAAWRRRLIAEFWRKQSPPRLGRPLASQRRTLFLSWRPLGKRPRERKMRRKKSSIWLMKRPGP